MQAERLRPDLVMDVRIPGMGGIRAAPEIGTRPLPTIVVVITGKKLDGLSDTAIAESVPWHRLSPTLLTRVWEDHRV
jgi:CheY-like chemotaxis protein